MLDIDKVDLVGIADALDDHSYEVTWYLHRDTGELVPYADWMELEGEDALVDPESDDWVAVEPVPSRAGYADMEDFIALVPDPRARDLLDRAIQGRGAFRRFKDTLYEFPVLREEWFAFHNTRMERRALQWLADEGLVEEGAANRAIAERADPVLEMPDPADEIVEAETQIMDALRQRDRDTLETLVGDDFTLTTGRPGAEVRSREEWLRVAVESYVLEDYEFEEITVQLYGDAAIARSRYRQRGALGDERRDTTYRMTDVWIRDSEGVWRLEARHAQPVEGD